MWFGGAAFVSRFVRVEDLLFELDLCVLVNFILVPDFCVLVKLLLAPGFLCFSELTFGARSFCFGESAIVARSMLLLFPDRCSPGSTSQHKSAVFNDARLLILT